MRKLFFIIAVSLVFLFLTSFQSFAECEGDFDCDGDVDGSDLATFAADFGRTDCSSISFTILGSAEFSGLGVTDYYEVRAYQTGDPQYPERRQNQIQLKLKAGSLVQQLLMAAATENLIPELKLFLGDVNPKEGFLEFQTLKVISVKYIPPIQNNDPFLAEVISIYDRMSFPTDCSSPPQPVEFINTVGYTGPLPIPGGHYDDYIPILNYRFSTSWHYGGVVGEDHIIFDPVEIVTTYN